MCGASAPSLKLIYDKFLNLGVIGTCAYAVILLDSYVIE